MASFSGSETIELALRRVGELLEADGRQHRTVIIGGSAMNLLGLVERATTDVDILAFASADVAGILRLRPPDEPIPADLAQAASTVAGDLGLAPIGSTLDLRRSGAPGCRRGWSAGWSGAAMKACGSE